MMAQIARFFLLFCLIGFSVNLKAQCTFTGPEIIAPNSSRFFNLEINGAVNNDLSSPTQGVCGVLIDFQHPLIGDLAIRLISPSNTAITLVGPIGITNFTNNTRWNVSFFPCSFPVDPDQGFLSQWSNIQNWGQFGYFEGAYHPASGCLEDFNAGPVNGIWQIEFINQYPFDVPVNSAILHDFTLLFCDPNGLNCDICLAKGGSLLAPEGAFCQGDSSLLLDIDRQIIGIQPDTVSYDYTYLIGRNGILQDTTRIPDLRLYNPGQYTVCGLSYAKDDADSIPGPMDGVNIFTLRNQLRSNTPPFCGSVSTRCLDIEILPVPDTTVINAFICPDESYYFQQDTLTRAGSYMYTFTSVNGCDSIVQLNITVPDIQVELSDIPILTCGDTIPVYIENINIDIIPNSVYWNWRDANGNVISSNDTFFVTAPGSYELALVADYGDLCFFNVPITVVSDYSPLEFSLSFPDTICQGSNASVEILNSGNLSINWQLSDPDLPVRISEDSKEILVTCLHAGDLEICISAQDTCTLLWVDTCITIHIIDLIYPEVGFDTLYCSLNGEVYLSGLTGIPSFDFQTGPGTVQVQQLDAEYISFMVSQPGDYRFQIRSDFMNCPFIYDQRVTFLQEPFPTSIEHTLVLCEPDSLIILLEFPFADPVITAMNIGGNQIDFELIGPGLRRIAIPYDEVDLPVSITGYTYSAYSDCHLPDDYSIDLSLILRPDLQLPDTLRSCNAENGPHPSEIDFSLYFQGNLTNVNIQNPSAIGSGPFHQFSTVGVAPGIYLFPFTWTYNPSCPGITGNILIEIFNCACEDLLTISELMACDGDTLALLDYENLHQGNWTWLERPNTSNIQIEAGQIIFHQQPPGLYKLLYTLDQGIENCPQNDTLEIVLRDPFYPGELTRDTLFICENLDTALLLNQYLTNHDPGQWVALPNPNITNTSWDSTSAIIQARELPVGTYYFRYESPSDHPCPGTYLELVLLVEAKKFEDLVADVTFGCYTPYAEFSIFLDTSLYRVNWEVLEGEFTVHDPSSYHLRINKEGRFRLEVLELRNHCITRETFTVRKIDNEIIDFDFIVNPPICPEDTAGSIEVTRIMGGIGPYDYGIDGQFQSGGLFENLRTDTFTLETVDSRGCRFSKDIVIPKPDPIELTIIGEELFTIGDTASFYYQSVLNSHTIQSISWYFEDELICQNCEELQMEVLRSGILKIRLITMDNCIIEVEKWIGIDSRALLFIPDAFSPNGDGINDTFQIFSPDPNIQVLRFSIFDRWGNTLYEERNFAATASGKGWDGKYKSQEMQPGIYIYSLIFERPVYGVEIMKGELFLSR
jgi:gliding motility-associated-like protein